MSKPRKPKTPEETAKALLRNTFKWIDFKYSWLTESEKLLCSEAEFKALIAWMEK